MKHQGSVKGKVLIVEDEEGVAEFVKVFFSEYGYDSDIAPDGKRAEHMLMKQDYCLILTDVIFFQSGGIDLIQTVRQGDAATPIVVMTGYGPDVAREAMEAGANDFLLKPFDLQEMKSRLGRYLDLDPGRGF